MKRALPLFFGVIMACSVIGTASAACVDESEHCWDVGEVVTIPTCTRDGIIVYACTNEGCDEKRTEVIAASGHQLGETVVVRDATCTQSGLLAAKCLNAGCSYTVEREIEKMEHIYVDGICACGSQKPVPFTDVAGHWGEKAIQYVYYRNIMNGVHTTRFAPDETLTRGMVVTVLYNMEGKPTVSETSPFYDVEENIWYSKPVIWAEKNGIVCGMGNGIFAPDQFITREQMATIMCRYAAFKGEDTSADVSLSAYSDAGKISDWAVSGMKWAVKNSVMSGKGYGIMDPLGTATRAECAKIIYNFLEK